MSAATKRTPKYEHVLDDPYFRKEVYEPEADSFLLLDAIDAEANELRRTARAHHLGNAMQCLEIGPGSGIALTHLATALVDDTEPDNDTQAVDGKTAKSAQRDINGGSNNNSSGGRVTTTCCCYGVDINPRALEATRRTFDNSVPLDARRSGRATLELVRGDLMTPFAVRAKFDVVLFNPPYVPTSLEELNDAVSAAARGESFICAAWAGGPDGRLVTDRVLPALPLLLRRPTGVAYVIALIANRIDDMIATVARASHGTMTGRVVVSRWTGEQLSVIKFYFDQSCENCYYVSSSKFTALCPTATVEAGFVRCFH